MDNKDITYVCYVQNYLGILDGEDVVSSMIATKKQEIIDKWLLDQIKEAEEIGYKPDEEVDSFMGMNDYVLTVSKGNEKEGFESYKELLKTTQEKRELFMNAMLERQSWINKLLQFEKAERLTREMVDVLIQRINLSGNNKIDISYKFSNLFDEIILNGGVCVE